MLTPNSPNAYTFGMTSVSQPQAPPERPTRGRRGTGSFDERKDALAESALRTLGELGYARTSLRDIAANSAFTHGVLHYYFRDKTDLIIYCVTHYKATCVRRFDGMLDAVTSDVELVLGFAEKLAETIVEESSMHRLWYDLRTQSMFESSLREAVLGIDATLEDMIWRVLTRYSELADRPLGTDSGTAYAQLDGIFERAVLYHLAGDELALTTLRERVCELLPTLLTLEQPASR